MLKKCYKYYTIFKSNDELDPLLFSSFSLIYYHRIYKIDIMDKHVLILNHYHKQKQMNEFIKFINSKLDYCLERKMKNIVS